MIKYNNLFPTMKYNGVLISDISHRFTLSPTLSSLVSKYHNIQIAEFSTPESISLRFYGTTDYWWLVLAINNIIDPLYDWLMSEDEVIRYCELKYGDDINEHHHYEDEEFNKYEADSIEMDRTPITNMEWELHLNDKKRRINIIGEKYLPIIENELNNMIKKYNPNIQE